MQCKHTHTIDTTSDIVCVDCGLVLGCQFATQFNDTERCSTTNEHGPSTCFDKSHDYSYRGREFFKRLSYMQALADHVHVCDTTQSDLEKYMLLCRGMSYRGRNKVLLDITCLWMAICRSGVGVSIDQYLRRVSDFSHEDPKWRKIMQGVSGNDLQSTKKKITIHTIKTKPSAVHFVDSQNTDAQSLAVNFCNMLRVHAKMNRICSDCHETQQLLANTNICRPTAIVAYAILNNTSVPRPKVLATCDTKAADVDKVLSFMRQYDKSAK